VTGRRRARGPIAFILRTILFVELFVVVGIGAYRIKCRLGIDLISNHHAWELFE
jgi:hypothetical protein